MSDLLSRDKKSVWHPFSPLKGGYPLKGLSGAKGVFLQTEDGEQIIDGISSWWVNTLGHSNEGIAQALYNQARNLEHVIFAGFTHEPAVALSEKLLELLPDNQDRVFFSDNGSTAVEVGLKMAIQYYDNLGQSKKKIVAIDGAYHGDTFGAMAVGERGDFTAPFHPYLFDVEFIPFPTGDSKNSIDKLQEICAQGDVAAFIFEPLIQGAAGMRIYEAEVLDEMIAIAHSHSVLCIADEVFTGFGRTGKFFASDHLTHKPDIFCLSKGLTAGTLPLSVTTASKDILEVFDTEDTSKTFYHGHSFTANPLGCAVALESLRQLESEEVKHSWNRLIQRQDQFRTSLEGHPSIKEAKSLGTLLSVELKSDGDTGYFNSMREYIYSYFIDRGILLRPLGNILYFLPPYIIEEKEIDHVHGAILEFLDSLSAS